MGDNQNFQESRTYDTEIQADVPMSSRSNDENKPLLAEIQRDGYETSATKLQAGVQTIEAISTNWTTWSLIVAYISYVHRLNTFSFQ